MNKPLKLEDLPIYDYYGGWSLGSPFKDPNCDHYFLWEFPDQTHVMLYAKTSDGGYSVLIEKNCMPLVEMVYTNKKKSGVDMAKAKIKGMKIANKLLAEIYERNKKK